MSKHTLRAISIGVSLYVCAAPLRAQDLALANDAKFESVSGYAGSTVTLGDSDGGHGISGIEWFEDSDEPCKLVLDNKNLNNANDIDRPQVTLSGGYAHAPRQRCSSPGNKKRVAFSGADNWIHKIQVCTTDKKDTADNKLKGIRIWATTVNQRSPLSLTRGAAAQEDKHTHCKKWHSAVACPAGKIAARIRVHHDALKEKIIGLALECRTLTSE